MWRWWLRVKLYKSENFQSDAAFSKTILLPSDIVCRQEALLSKLQ
jgi:hypothetical protein